MTRIKRMKENSEEPMMPENPAPYLTDWLMDIGPSVQGGMAEAEIGYRELQAWQDVIGVELMPWEARILRRLSKDFCSERQRARKPDALAPYDPARVDEKAAAEKVDRQFAALFKALGGPADAK